MATRLILVRHGEAQGNIERLYQGITDGYLSEKGHMQAKLASERLKQEKIDVIYASPLKRTMLTAKYTSEYFNLPINETKGLIEFHGGLWENQPFDRIIKERTDEYNHWMYKPHSYRMPEGESFVELRDRALTELEEIVNRHPGKCICCFTHGTLTRSIMPHFMKMKFEDLIEVPWYENTAISIIDFPNDNFEEFNLVCAGDSQHLGLKEKTVENQKWYQDLQKYIITRRSMSMTKQLKNHLEELKTNSYPGRGIVIGKTLDGTKAAIAYFIMGRSPNSRNRVFVEEGLELRTKAYDESKVEDPSLIIYYPVRKLDKKTIVTNGDQTDTIYNFMKEGKSFDDALATRNFEPDPPNLTPRISGLVDVTDGELKYKLSIVKSFYANGDATIRNQYSYDSNINGIGHFIHTYAENINPLPSFVGEPKTVHIPNDINEFANTIWNDLDEENKISLFVRYIDIATDECETIVFNKNK